MKYLLLSIMFIFAGCGIAQPTTPNIVKVKQKCLEDINLMRPSFMAEDGDEVQYTEAIFINNERRKSYIYDLEAELNKCK